MYFRGDTREWTTKGREGMRLSDHTKHTHTHTHLYKHAAHFLELIIKRLIEGKDAALAHSL